MQIEPYDPRHQDGCYSSFAWGRKFMDLEKLLQAGDLAQQAGEYVEAESIWRGFLKHYPGNAYVYLKLGMALDYQGQGEKAIWTYQNAIRIAPNYSAAYVNMAATLADRQRFSEAMTVYRKAIEIDSSQAQAFVGLGMVLVNLERYGEAINGT